MMTVQEVSKLTGLTIRTLRYYDSIGLLEPTAHTEAYREYRQKSANRTEAQEQTAAQGLMDLFREFGTLQEKSPDAPEAQAQVEKLRQYITAHYYTCTPEILAGLGKMYAAGGEFTENIDAVGGPGTAAFVDRAIQVYCKK